MTSKTEICNMALSHIASAHAIQDVDTEASLEAEKCNLFYDHCRSVLLEMRPWSFAERTVALASVGSPPAQWGYRYKLPNFVKRPNHIVHPSIRTPGRGKKIPFKTVDLSDGYGKALLTDEADAVLNYNADVDDPALYSSTFIHAFALFLATNIAMPLRASAEIQDKVKNDYYIWVAETAALDLEEEEPDQEPESEFVAVRG